MSTRATPEEIAAFADGELPAEREAAMRDAMAADPELAKQVERHRALAARLSQHYAPVLDERVPDRLTDLLTARSDETVVDFAAARQKQEAQKREASSRRPHWGWIAGPALAASLAIAVILGDSDTGPGAGYAGPQLAAVLDDQLVAEQSPAAETRVLLSFEDQGGQFCRAYSGVSGGGIACRDEEGWRIERRSEGSEAASTDFRMAGADDGAILAQAQEMAAGPALDAAGEQAARERGWR
ncbi:MAG: hypothetical protein GW854_09280 [Erythrobacter sp.]|nr:hypothetical protein [Erythrobacter sp.]